jgi:glycosyltransferase involved in cell wall biosynthesis
MNLLFVHETEYIEKMIFEYQIIPEILASRGHHVFVIDFPARYSENDKRSIIFVRPEVIENVSRARKAGKITLIRPARVQIPFLHRLSAFFSYLPLIDSVIREHKIDAIVLLSAPTNGIQTLIAARKNGIPVYFRLLDVLHRLVPVDILRWPTYVFEKIIYRNVDWMTAITPRLRDYAVSMGARPETSHYLPSGSDADLFYYQPKDKELLLKYGIKADDLVLLFAGTLYNFSGLDKIINRLPDEVLKTPNIKLLIIGAGEQEAKLKGLVQRWGLENVVIFTGFINYPVLPSYINLADICLNPFEINKITNIIFPGKIYQYLACEKPVIATKLQGMLDVFPCNDLHSGIFYYETLEEFFGLVSKINRQRIKDPNPPLQEIANVMEEELRTLCFKMGASE